MPQRAMNASQAVARQAVRELRYGVFESVAQEVSRILNRMLEQSLYPRTFTGTLGIAIHFQAGSVCHIREIDDDQFEPGMKAVAAADENGTDVAKVLNSAMSDLEAKLASIEGNFWGVLALTMVLNAGICRKVSWARDQIHKRAAPYSRDRRN